MTYKQSWTLYKFTQRDWRKVTLPTKQASELVGLCIKYYIQKENVKEELERMVRLFFPDWEADMSKYKEKKTEPQNDKPQEDQNSEKERQEPLPGSAAKCNTDEGGAKKEAKAEEVEGAAREEDQKSMETESIPKEQKKEEDIPPEEPEKSQSEKTKNLALKIVKSGQNLLLVGPAGCGKTWLAREIAKTLDMPYFCVSFAGGLRYSQVFGRTEIVNGDTKFTASGLIENAQKRCIIILDEIFSADPEISEGLNGLLEVNTRCIDLPIGNVVVHSEARFIACANTIGRVVSRKYTGAQKSDDSLLDRFTTVKMDYDPDLEKKLVTEILDGRGEKLLEKVWHLREKCKAENIEFDVSTRRLISASILIKKGKVSFTDALDAAFLNNLSQNERERLAQ